MTLSIRGGLVKFIEHRIADRRVLRLIQKWLKAGHARRTPAPDVGGVWQS